MDLDSIRTAMVGAVQAVPDAGNIYDRYKYSSDWSKFLDQFYFVPVGGKKQIRGWWVTIPTCRTAVGAYSAFGDEELIDTLTWTLRGILSFSDTDGSELVFSTLIYTVRDALRSRLTLGLGGTIIVPGSINVSVPAVDVRQFGSILCHYAELQIVMETHVGQIDYVS